eukprot:m.158864 g.158864  ORF g.158864 m.158864 type:complete len:201 (+) comp10253_c1_seq3:2542-3144(+)
MPKAAPKAKSGSRRKAASGNARVVIQQRARSLAKSRDAIFDLALTAIKTGLPFPDHMPFIVFVEMFTQRYGLKRRGLLLVDLLKKILQSARRCLKMHSGCLRVSATPPPTDTAATAAHPAKENASNHTGSGASDTRVAAQLWRFLLSDAAETPSTSTICALLSETGRDLTASRFEDLLAALVELSYTLVVEICAEAEAPF